MTDPELIRRAEAAGIAPCYLDWREERVEVSGETLAAILAALDSVPEADTGTRGRGGEGAARRGGVGAGLGVSARAGQDGVSARAGQDGVSARAGQDGVSARAGQDGARPRAPGGRSWGFTVQLYSVRSRNSWGHGDLHDLADLASWSARDLGAGFVLINPLHAAEPRPPISPSPYLPMTRRYVSPLYLRVEDIPEFQRLDAGQRERIGTLAAPLRARNATPDLIDRDAVWAAKREALEIIHRVPLSGRRREDYQRYRQREGRDLEDWAAWCVRADRYGPDWRTWPEPDRRPGRAAAAADAAADADADFHAWLQWLADEQLAAAQRAALAAGMGTGIITDLAVGAHPGGSDAWAHQDLLVGGLSVGAPPDEFNQRGQDWSQPPWHPRRLAAVGYRPLADLFAAALRHAGGLRVDHVMGLMRLWCVPLGMPPDRGAYIRYDHRASVAALAGQAGRAGALAIGEDLGTVDDWIREDLAASGIMGTEMLWFAREPDGKPLEPAHWRRESMATVGTHDVPPIAAFRTGEQVAARARLGLLKQSEDAERNAAEQMLSSWRDALVAQGLLPPGPLPGPDQFTVALYGYLNLTAAALIGVSLADAVGDRRAQNIPGTRDEYPNWQMPLCDASGQAVLLENLADLPLVQAVARAAAGQADVRDR